MMRPPIQLLWGRPGRWACDYAARQIGPAGEPRFRDCVGTPPLYLQHPTERRDDDPDVWSTRSTRT